MHTQSGRMQWTWWLVLGSPVRQDVQVRGSKPSIT